MPARSGAAGCAARFLRAFAVSVRPCAEDMYCPHPFKRIARKGTGIGVEGVRSHERNASEKSDGEEGMVKISARSPELVRKLYKNSTPVQDAVRSFAER